ncbi:hypothetical protein BE08_18160 [Sorangium cellulosum]|uniref:DUF4398 domain-containing protein n=1 Tax=Sorangium cellulosum TaxID=56 RepID=A0A150PUM4_SORCE|nr:hypothetical protein BE08_18160 [Sorangium cellulosum]
MREAVIVTLLGASAAGCAARAPTFDERVFASQALIRAAEEVGVEEIPRADLHLRLAREQVERARRLSAEGAPDRARRMLLRAQADAELAIACAREARAQALAREAVGEVGSTQEQLR